jgi:hypothetical protein
MREQFMRIAMARLRSTYPFKPQRRAVAAKMWVEYLERNLVTKSTTNLSPCSAHARQQEWAEQEEQLNKRMDIIGQNGNLGTHYE